MSEPSKTRSALALLGFLAASLSVGIVSGYVTAASIPAWYDGLRKPPLTPPNGVFGPVWLALYVLMAVAVWLAWKTRVSTCRTGSLRLWWIQLAVNLAWVLVYFGLRAPGVAVIDLILLIVALWMMLPKLRIIRPLAAWLWLPYLAWCCFALYLNLGTWYLNR